MLLLLGAPLAAEGLVRSAGVMYRTTRVLEAMHRSNRPTAELKRRLSSSRLWEGGLEHNRAFATSAPSEAEDALHDDAGSYKGTSTTMLPRAASAEVSPYGSSSFVPRATVRAIRNGARPVASRETYYEVDYPEETIDTAERTHVPEPFAESLRVADTAGLSSRDALNALINTAPVHYKAIQDYPSIEAFLAGEGIRSRPVAGGNWNVPAPLQWTEGFGRRSPAYDTILRDIVRLGPGDVGYYAVGDLQMPGTAIVRTKAQAEIVLAMLTAADRALFHACDTEVMDIDLKSVGPVGNGYCTCVSIYSGPDFDYGLGHGPGATLWIDNLDDACGILQEFKGWFEDERFLKVWHNYGFDRHVMWNEGIDVRGFGGDTMHMARLQDSSRARTEGASGEGYGLEALTSDLINRRKQPMKEIFGIKRMRKDGTEGMLVDMPPVEVMQRDPKYRAKWIKYSCYDAEGTWLIREKLAELLVEKAWINDTNMYDYYWMHMRPFGEVLTDMERRGIRVDANEYLAKVEIQAREDRAHHVEVFRQWAATKIGADGLALNTASSVQLGTFLFGGADNVKTKEATEKIRVFKVPRDEVPEDALEAYRRQNDAASEAESNGTSCGHTSQRCVW